MENPYLHETAKLGLAFYIVFISQILALITPVYQVRQIFGAADYVYLFNIIDFFEFLIYRGMIGCTYYFYVNRYRLENQAILPLIIILVNLYFISRINNHLFIVELATENEADLRYASFFLLVSLVIFVLSLSPFETKKKITKNMKSTIEI